MEERIVTRHIGRSTWQGPESEAPDEPLPIDLPVIGDQEPSSPLQTLGRRDLVYIAIGMFACFAGGALALWMLR